MSRRRPRREWSAARRITPCSTGCRNCRSWRTIAWTTAEKTAAPGDLIPHERLRDHRRLRIHRLAHRRGACFERRPFESPPDSWIRARVLAGRRAQRACRFRPVDRQGRLIGPPTSRNRMRRAFSARFIGLALALLCACSGPATTPPPFDPGGWVCYFGPAIPPGELPTIDLAILEPDEWPDVRNLAPAKKIGYLSIGECGTYRPYWPLIRNKPWVGKENPNWPGDIAVDIRSEEWQGPRSPLHT